MNKKLIREVATSLIIVAFIGIAITGLMLMAGIYSISELHQNLGLLLIVAAVGHIYVNFNAFKRYLTNKIFIVLFIIMILSIIISVIFPEN
jgi:hypothetical protein